VTIHTYQQAQLFGKIYNSVLVLSEYGKVVKSIWEYFGQRILGIETDVLCVMPNHLQGVILIHRNNTKENLHSTRMIEQSYGPSRGSPGMIIGQFKSEVTKRLWKYQELAGQPIWLRNYYEHIIRDEKISKRVCQYIELNPAMWHTDDTD
jgi:REP element-mobilizing transposase RayT